MCGDGVVEIVGVYVEYVVEECYEGVCVVCVVEGVI